MADVTLHFPPGFLWGTSTAAHQVEGNNTNNDWWQWEHSTKSNLFEERTSGNACEWWQGRAEEDIARMAALGTNAHRLSVEWSRIEPEPGEWDYAAIDRYREILSAMKAVHIRPMVTLHHFTNPIWLAEDGAWLNDATPEKFARFAQKIVAELSDLCDLWCTVNEPAVLAFFGYLSGLWPPQHTSPGEYFTVLLNLLRAHAMAYHAIKDVQPESQIGLAKHIVAWHAERRFLPDYLMRELAHSAFNTLVLDTLKTGVFKPTARPKIPVPEVANTLDWIGLNYYQRFEIAFAPFERNPLFARIGTREGRLNGPKDWGEFYARGLFDGIALAAKRFGNLPIYITENGIPDKDDTNRPAFMLRHLRELWRAATFKAQVYGYFWWSLVDNYEWAEGYDPRYQFGLYHVDFKTQRRTLRKSGELYQEIVKANAIDSRITRTYLPEATDELFPGIPPNTEEDTPTDA